MALKIPLKGAWLRLRQNHLVDAWVTQRGPSARRVPQVLRQRVVFQNAIAALHNTRVWSFVPRHQAQWPLHRPTNVKNVEKMATVGRPGRLPAPFVARIEGGWLVGRHATPFTMQGRMLLTPFLDRLPLLGADRHADLERWVQGCGWSSKARSAEEDVWSEEAICSLVGRLDKNFFHWIIDICGQLEALSFYQQQAGDEPRILIRAESPPFVRQSLEMLGFPSSRLLEWPLAWAPGQDEIDSEAQLVARRVGRMVVPSWRSFGQEQPPHSLRWLRRTFLHAGGAAAGAEAELEALAGGSPGPKLYLHRAPGGWRWVENGDEVCAFLEARGFEILRPEAIELAEQVRLFARASVVVGMHGAALTSLLFAPRAHIFELIGSYGGPDYAFIAQVLGNPYTRVSCSDVKGNIRVDLSRLGHALKSVP